MNSKTILVADDDPALVQVLELRCRALGFDVRVAHSGLAALKSACQQPPDLICLDVDMPGGNGFSACELLAGEPQLSHVPIIILTGKTDGETIRRCHNLCAYYVPKCADVWARIAPLLQELLDQQPFAVAE
ncbi:MAG TPA: response regulator [Pirellulales bacterium]|jgi:CheY-like chemotaxis protein|nr:response regulator [Pirellulales bacterium]